ncbi:hypothetical protein BJX63DRAFT_66964 [Aspergillus granulosus]|uniref:Uncharacterized protein n=1 Tax=Aspergillus granulosus TaxID=176169 RepID=A0ABR4GWQ7_9EURO
MTIVEKEIENTGPGRSPLFEQDNTGKRYIVWQGRSFNFLTRWYSCEAWIGEVEQIPRPLFMAERRRNKRPTFSEFIHACHALLSTPLKVETPSRSTQGTIPLPTGKYCRVRQQCGLQLPAANRAGCTKVVFISCRKGLIATMSRFTWPSSPNTRLALPGSTPKPSDGIMELQFGIPQVNGTLACSPSSTLYMIQFPHTPPAAQS